MSPMDESESRPDLYPADPWANALYHHAQDVLLYLRWRAEHPGSAFIQKAAPAAIRRIVDRLYVTVNPPAPRQGPAVPCTRCGRVAHTPSEADACARDSAPGD